MRWMALGWACLPLLVLHASPCSGIVPRPRAPAEVADSTANVTDSTHAARVPDSRLIRSGQRVRFRVMDHPNDWIQPRWAVIQGDSLRFLAGPSSDTNLVALSSVAGLERRTGRHDHPVEGAVLGLASGYLIAGLPGSRWDDSEDGPSFKAGPNWPYGAVGGFFLGAIVGALVREDTWESIDLGTPREISGRGVGIQVSVRF